MRVDAKETHLDKTATRDNSPRRNAFLFLAIVPTIFFANCQPKLPSVQKSEPLHFNEKEPNLAFTTKPTCNVISIYRITVRTKGTAVHSLDREAGVNLLHTSRVLSGWKHRNSCHNLSRLSSATR